jgi:RHS repeat-associated protein
VYFGPVEVRNWLILGAEQVLTYPHPAVKLVNGTTPAVATYLHRDGLSSVRTITNSAGVKTESALYKPFGEQSEWLLPGNTSAETKGWIGERFDADAGLQYLNARYYDPELSLFLQPDWLEVTKEGVGTNRFSYSFNDPVNGSDPNGNLCLPCGIVTVGAISYFSGTAPANAPGPGDPVLPPNDRGIVVGAAGGGAAVAASKLAAGSCMANAACRNAVAAYVRAETVVDVTGCASGDMGSCAATAVPGVPGVGANAAEPSLKGVLEGSKKDDGFTGVIDSKPGGFSCNQVLTLLDLDRYLGPVVAR